MKFRIGERVECRDFGRKWNRGTVAQITPLKVRLDGFSSAFEWEEVRAFDQNDTIVADNLREVNQCVLQAKLALEQNANSIQSNGSAVWTTQAWVGSSLSSTIADALNMPIAAEDNPQLQLYFMRALAMLGSRSAVMEVLYNARVLDKLADHIWNNLQRVGGATEVSPVQTPQLELPQVVFQATIQDDVRKGEKRHDIGRTTSGQQNLRIDACIDESPSSAITGTSASRPQTPTCPRLPKSQKKRWREWSHSVKSLDPRKQIADFFRSGDSRGPAGYLECHNLKATGDPSAYFSIWRHTSNDSIRMMIQGTATGKGLNVKGKSAKQGHLSGYVPFLQISDNKHKKLCTTCHRDSRTLIYYQSSQARDMVAAEMGLVLDHMVHAVEFAEMELEKVKAGKLQLDDGVYEELLVKMLWKMDDPRITLIDTFAPDCFGVDVPERLKWEFYVIQKDIVPKDSNWETGRASEPAFMDMNLHSVRDNKEPKVVLWQYDTDNPFNPRGLLMSYQEDRVRPVASDIDAFCVGSRGLAFSPLSDDQQELVHWLLNSIQEVLEHPQPEGWISRWLDVLKRESQKGFHPEMPKYGFGDPTSYDIMAKAVQKLNLSGAVRHGAECFNYYFPQDLDQQFLIVWGGFTPSPWKYMNQEELRGFLLDRIEDGFSFPLNPKWVLCDPGWFEVFQALQRSKAARAALNCWFPPSSGIIEKINAVHAAYPAGFTQTGHGEPLDPDLAHFELQRYMTLQRAKKKMRAFLFLKKLHAESTSDH